MAEVLAKFIHITDTHITPGDRTEMNTSRYSERLISTLKEMMSAGAEEGHKGIPGSIAARQLVEEINNLPFDVDFVLHSGDVMTDPYTPEEYEAAKELLGQIKFPIHYLNGNHDLSQGIQSVLIGRDESAITPTLDYTFELNGVQFVMVDSATHGVDHGGCLSDDQLNWLDAQISAGGDAPLVVGIHHHIVSLSSPYLDFFGTSNGSAIHQILKKAGSRLRGVFSGHIHQAIDIYHEGILYSFAPNNNLSSNLWPGAELTGKGHPSTLPGFSLVTITNENTYIRRYAYPLNDSTVTE